MFASALLHAPRVLVVDEPMIGLDPHSIRLVKDLLQREVAAGMCVLMSTHTLTAAEEISNRVGIMNHGQLLFDGTIDELRERFPVEKQSLETMYLSLTEKRTEHELAARSRSIAVDRSTGEAHLRACVKLHELNDRTFTLTIGSTTARRRSWPTEQIPRSAQRGSRSAAACGDFDIG